MRACTFVLWVAACAKPHVDLRLPPNPTPEQREQTYAALHAVGEETVITRCTNGCGTTIEKTLRLANGTEVYHADDLLPAVNEDSLTARSVRAMHAAQSNQLRFGLYALGSFAAFAIIGFKGFSSSGGDGMGVGYKVALVATGAATLAFAFGTYHYMFVAADHWGEAHINFNHSLAQRLNVCVSGLVAVACER